MLNHCCSHRYNRLGWMKESMPILGTAQTSLLVHSHFAPTGCYIRKICRADSIKTAHISLEIVDIAATVPKHLPHSRRARGKKADEE